MSEEERREYVRRGQCTTAYVNRHQPPAEVAAKLGERASYEVSRSIRAIGLKRCVHREDLDAPPKRWACGSSERRVLVYVTFEGDMEPLRAAGLDGADPIDDAAMGRIEIRRLCDLARVRGVRHVDIPPEVDPH
jgi:hypothetical protein